MKALTQKLALVLGGFLLMVGVSAQQPTLKVGDPAPPLVNGKYLKGEPVRELEKGKVYVLEFWATWCGPCIAAIPHVSKLQEKFADEGVIVIGQNVFERDESQVEPFLKRMGDKMDYRVALDDKSENERGAMATTWMAAAGQNGIPCSFIIDREGKIAWIGHPMTMEPVLEAVVAGNFDTEKHAALEAKKKSIQERLVEAAQQEDFDAAIAATDELIAVDPTMTEQLALVKFRLLAMGKKDMDAATAQARNLVEDSEEPMLLNELAWSMVAPDSQIENFDLDLALKAAKKANRLSGGNDASILDTLARVHYAMGDVDEAIAVQKKAVGAAEDRMKTNLQNTLKEYEDEQ